MSKGEAARDSALWSVEGTLKRDDNAVLTEEKMDAFTDAFCVLAEQHGLLFNGGWMPLSQAQIDGEEA